ncbi:EF-hand and coiled-coil domain-containing protein 1-like [Rhincodon typus]|uniref:EF-hand and coiled-coil domain-containing protein 1-like n=1 Tax=Rhincodon typus TaxID=259920 RepID=UPI00202E1CD8|nr:EF-hand and coiled-coil domain-containing protein 1-like [Rhincodon typus]
MLGFSDSRPGRRTSWLVSALSHHFGSEGGQVDNEIVVLATGLDQYLQEIFHHLDYEGDGLVSGEDFRALCSVLGLEEGVDGPPEAVTFRHFHALLCEPFHRLLGRGEPGNRLPVSQETEHIERQIRLRCPRRRRRKKKKRSVSFQLPRDGGEEDGDEESPEPGAEEAQQDPSAGELENASLRELVEDLRGALQSSDARCLALEVGLRKVLSGFPGAPRRQTQEPRPPSLSCCSVAHVCPGSRHLLRELELIRTSRDGQIDEARRLNRQLEQELRDAHCRLGHREYRLAALRAEHGRLRDKAERVTAALRAALDNVKELERRVRQVPVLESQVQELQHQMQRYRLQEGQGRKDTALLSHSQHWHKYYSSRQNNWSPSFQRARSPPTGKADCTLENRECYSSQNGDPSCNEDEGHLLRAVEGCAASDEEEERGTEDQHCQMMELNRDGCSREGCHCSTLQQLLCHNCSCENRENGSMVFPPWMEREKELTIQLKNKEEKVTELQTETEKLSCAMTKELQLKGEEVEMLRIELQMVETDRVRLSLIEEKLTDVLQLLQQLRTLNVSRRSLGKILMNTLDSCYSVRHGMMSSLDILSVLHKELLSCELLTKGSCQTEDEQIMKNSLVISC